MFEKKREVTIYMGMGLGDREVLPVTVTSSDFPIEVGGRNLNRLRFDGTVEEVDVGSLSLEEVNVLLVLLCVLVWLPVTNLEHVYWTGLYTSTIF